MKKLYSVQYLRACAALLVLVAHSFSYQIGTDRLIIPISGHAGVVLFFIISGFIMVYISGKGPFHAPTFLKRRAIRIVPLYWLFTSMAALAAALMPNLFQTTVFTWSHFFQSLFFIVHEAPEKGGASPLLSLGWTLNYEVYFYILFALAAFLAVTSRALVLTVFFVAMWVAGLLTAPADPVLQFYLGANPLAFVVGMWIGWLHLNGRLTYDARRARILGFAALAGAVLAFVDDGTLLLVQISFAGQVVWAAGLLLLGLILEPKLKHWRLLEQLGDASYSLYLSHIFVIGVVVFLARRIIGSEGALTVILIAMASIVAACIASLLIHGLIEKPMLRALRGKRKPGKAMTAQAAGSK